jgi:hypothetical protein
MEIECGLCYGCTNESLPAIRSGLKPEKGDNILAILGSGDQAFELLRGGAKVTATDNNPAQIDYALRRVAFLRQASFLGYELFLAHNRWLPYDVSDSKKIEVFPSSAKARRDAHFTPEVLREIAANIGNLSITREDIFQLAMGGRFNKIYLSNAIGYCDLRTTPRIPLPIAGDFLEMISRFIPARGLIYVSNGDEVKRHFSQVLELLEVDEESTGDAKKLEALAGKDFMPIVFRKI